MRTCNRCAVEKPFDAFPKDRKAKHGVAYRCKECSRAVAAAWRAANPGAHVEHKKAWREANQDKLRAASKRWKRANPDAVMEMTRYRQMMQKLATPKWLTTDDRWLIREAYALAKLRKRLLGGSWDVDHIVPICGETVTGLHVPWNLQVIPTLSNQRKSNTHAN